MYRLLSYIVLLGYLSLKALTLKEVYDSSSSGNGYEKYIILENGGDYYGGLYLNGVDAVNTAIIGNGAKIYLENDSIVFSNTDKRLDITDCFLIYGGIYYIGETVIPKGEISYCTFYEPYHYGVNLKYCGTGIAIKRNIVVNAIEDGGSFTTPTGINFVFSNKEQFGFPDINENWSFNSQLQLPNCTRNFARLCETG
ncbi:MAG: hypothetical protein JXR48_08295 [Candidatus Delongbacteria bacterium]|nr:hypothetical protein [Candidatus Delongbacteria bacterium]MBN2834954.1 hypothetical protein [Candidatus Delongbacteria bacterium]